MWIALSLLGAIVLFAVVVWMTRQQAAAWIREEIGASLRRAHEEFLDLAGQRMQTERAQHVGDLEARKIAVEKTVQSLELQLAKYEQLLRKTEQDRATKYGALEQQLASAAKETEQLRHTTGQLTAMLGNARVRGQWGEKTADDILQLCGLQEGVHYQKQKNAPLGRPDFTFLLPGAHRCYMDVKFPLDNYIRWANAQREEERRGWQEQFLKDVRGHLKALERRDYAPSSEAAPDYVLMFIPNEQVYGAVNEWMQGLIDEALARRIILCGPWTLYATVRLIWQAWQNYYQAETIGEIAKTVAQFQDHYGRFKRRFEELGEKLVDVSRRYEEIAKTSFAQLERKIQQIEDYRKGHGVSAPLTMEPEPIDAVPTGGAPHD